MIKSNNKAFLDANFFINLINSNNAFHKNANDYFEIFLRNAIDLYTSTICIAEYCVKGKVTDLPLRYIKVMSFDLKDAVKTGETARILFENKKTLDISERNIIPNDTKILTQAENLGVNCFVTADIRLKSIFKFLSSEDLIYSHLLDITVDANTNFGFLPNIESSTIFDENLFKNFQRPKKKY